MALHLILDPKPHTQDLCNVLTAALPKYKVKIPSLNPGAVMVTKGASRVFVNNRDSGLTIAGSINTGDLGIALGIGIGVLLGIIGAFIFLAIAYFSNQDNFRKMEREVEAIIKRKYQIK